MLIYFDVFRTIRNPFVDRKEEEKRYKTFLAFIAIILPIGLRIMYMYNGAVPKTFHESNGNCDDEGN
jgi:hypothetical protein